MNRRYQRESIASSLLRYSTGASLNSGPSASSPPSAQPETRGGALPGAYDLHGYGRCRSLLLGIANMDNVRCKHVAARDRGRHRDSSSCGWTQCGGSHGGRVATTASMPWKPTTAQADCGLQLICRGRALVPIGRNDWARQKPCRRRRRPRLVRGSVAARRVWMVRRCRPRRPPLLHWASQPYPAQLASGVWRWRNDGTQEMSMGRVVIPIPTSPLGHARSPAALHARNQGPSRVVLHQTDLRRAPSTSRVSQTNAASLGRAPGDEGIRDSAMGGGLRVVVGLLWLSIRTSLGWQRDGSKLWMPSSPWSLG